eukprot:COSAG01_NODE_199_length_22202_cov_23.993668_24_plen_227_part_00
MADRRPLRGAAWGVGFVSAVALAVAVVAVVTTVVSPSPSPSYGRVSAAAAAAFVAPILSAPRFISFLHFPRFLAPCAPPCAPASPPPPGAGPGREVRCRPAAVCWPRARPPGRPPSSRRQTPARPPGCFRVHRRPVGSPPLRAAAVGQSQVAARRVIAVLFTCRGHISPPGVLEGRAKRGAPRTFLAWMIVVFWAGCGPRRLRPVSVYGGGARSHPHHERPRASWA